jgi:hypothetical protein
MLIRALSDEMAEGRAHNVDSESQDRFSMEMAEALYELRLRKLLICAFGDSDLTMDNTTLH